MRHIDIGGRIKSISWLTPNLAVLALTCVCMALYFCALPHHLDDSWYNYASYPWLKAHGYLTLADGVDIFRDGLPWDSIAETWRTHYQYDNVRMADIFLPVMLFFPSWLNASMLSVCFGLTVVMLCRLAGVDPWRSPLMPLMTCMLCLSFPWRENIAVFAYQINYFGAMFVCVALVYYVRRHVDGRGWPTALGALLFGLFAGTWHEGFTAPVCGGLGLVWLIVRRARTRVVFLAALGMSVGFLLLMSSPGMHDRTDVVAGAPDLAAVKYVAEGSAIWFVALMATVWGGMRIGWKRLWSNPFFLFTHISALLSVAVSLASTRDMRAMWWTYVMSPAIIVYLLRAGAPRWWERYSRRNVAVAVVAVAVLSVMWGYVTAYGFRMRSEYRRLRSEWQANPGETRWSPLVEHQDFPLPCAPFFFQSFTNYIYAFPMSYEAYVLDDDYQSPFGYESLWGVVPESLRLVTAACGREVPGGSGVRVVDGHYFMPAGGPLDVAMKEADSSMAHMSILIDFGKGYVSTLAQVIAFRSEADGRRYFFIAPDRNMFLTFVKKIRGVRMEGAIMVADRYFVTVLNPGVYLEERAGGDAGKPIGTPIFVAP